MKNGKTLTTPVEVLKTEVDQGRATISGNQTFTAVGTETINITWNGFTKPINVTVKSATLTPNYTAPTEDNTFKYGNPENKQLDLTGGKIEITNKAGTVVETIDLSVPNSRVTFGTPDFEDLTPDQPVDVMLDGTKVGEILITVQDYIKGIKVEGTTNPGYEPGDKIDLTGGYVGFEWASKKPDATKISLTDSRVTVNGGNLTVGSTLGKVSVPVVYTGVEGTFNGTFDITVKDESRNMTLTEPTGDNTFKYGNPDNKTINKTGGKITVTNKAGAVIEEINLTDPRVTFETPNFTDLTPGQTVDVMLDGEVIGQIPVTIEDYVMDIILTAPTDTDYEVGDTSLKLGGGTLQIIKASEAGRTLTTPIVNLADEVTANRATLGTYDLTIKGTQSISVTWEGKTKSFGITVNDSILSISMHNPPKETQTYGEAIVLTGADGNPAQIAVTRSSGTTYVDITSTMIPGYNPNQLGPQTVTVTHEGKTTTFNVNVKDKINGIKITKPTKLEYEVGEMPDFSTGTVEFTYAGGTTDPNPVSLVHATDVTVTIMGDGMTKPGNPQVKVEYGGYTEYFSIKVVDEARTITVTPPADTNPNYGENIDLSGGNIHIAKKSGDEDVPLTSPRVQIKNYNPKDLNTQNIDVYLDGEKVGNFQVTVRDAVQGLKIVPPTKQEVEWGTEMDLTRRKSSNSNEEWSCKTRR